MMAADGVEEMAVLAPLLRQHWGLRAGSARALPTGHTNKTYAVQTDERPVVLRVSWAGKPARQVRDEARVLAHLAAAPELPRVPRARCTLDGRACLPWGRRWLHVFEHIPGAAPGMIDAAAMESAIAPTIAPSLIEPALERAFIESDIEPAMASITARAMRTLAHVHRRMATLPVKTADPAAWLRARHARVAARPSPALADIPAWQYAAVQQRIGILLATLPLAGPVQWLHGDYHAGNLLFLDGEISGILDFDDVGPGSPWLEAAFALFALSRDTRVEDGFAFDADIWHAGLHAYAQAAQPPAPSQWLHGQRDALLPLFCADQVLVHLEAAQRGLWTPGPGMGFLGCWRQLLGLPSAR